MSARPAGVRCGLHLHFEIFNNGKPTNPMINLALRGLAQPRGGELERFKMGTRDLGERDREAGRGSRRIAGGGAGEGFLRCQHRAGDDQPMRTVHAERNPGQGRHPARPRRTSIEELEDQRSHRCERDGDDRTRESEREFSVGRGGVAFGAQHNEAHGLQQVLKAWRPRLRSGALSGACPGSPRQALCAQAPNHTAPAPAPAPCSSRRSGRYRCLGGAECDRAGACWPARLESE